MADAPLTERFRTDLAVTTRDGAVHQVRVVAPHGAPWDPVTNDELIAKFHALTDRVTNRDRADRHRTSGGRPAKTSTTSAI